MDELHRKILRENRSYLVGEIEDVVGIIDILLEKQILTNSMYQDVMAENTLIGCARKLLDTIPRRGQQAFGIFCNALIKTGQRHIAEKLNPDLKTSGVTAVPSDPVPNKTNTSEAKSSAQPTDSKSSNSKPSHPVPVQVPIKDNNPKSSSLPPNDKHVHYNLPNPANVTGAAGTAAGSQPSTPNDDRYQPAPGGQVSKEGAPVYTPTDDERLLIFPQPVSGWPYKLDMTLASDQFKVQHCTSVEIDQQLNDPNTYCMPENRIRRALIINNRTFDDDRYEDRKLADLDSCRIQQVLEKLAFKIKITTNVNKENLMSELTMEKEQDGNELCIFVLVILSYGGSGTIMCTDGQMVHVQDIVNLFSAKNCPLMVGVPKLFLLQACGTKMKDYSDSTEAATAKESAIEHILSGMESLQLGRSAGVEDVPDTKGRLHSSASESSLSDPLSFEDTNDMLVAMATTADENHAQYNSLFMLGLSYVICNFAKSDHFITLLKGVNRLKKCDSSDSAMKLCEIKHSFTTKKLYLLPGYQHDKPGGATGGDSSLPPAIAFGSTKPTQD